MVYPLVVLEGPASSVLGSFAALLCRYSLLQLENQKNFLVNAKNVLPKCSQIQ